MEQLKEMDSIGPQLGTTRVESVEVVSQNGSTTIVAGGLPLLDGGERNGYLHLRFTEHSGAHAEFDVTGASSPDGLHLSGAGTVRLGDLALSNAEVRVTLAGVEIAAPIEWAGHRATVRFEVGAALGQWRGRFEAREALPCLITRREVLRTSITIELDAHARRSTYVALAVLEGRNIKVPALSESHSEQDGFLSRLRQRTLVAVREFLLEELAVCEAELAAVDSDDDSAEAPLDTPVQAEHIAHESTTSRATAAVRRHESGSGPLAGGYLPTSPGVARTSGPQSNATVRGYLDPRHAATMPTGQGYLPASPRDHRVATGYLPNPRTTQVSGSAGYLPSGWRVASGQAPSTRPTLQEEHGNRAGTSPMPPRESLNATIDFGRIAYAVLRCKDLLGAVEAAESQGAGA